MISSSYPADQDDARGIFIHRLARSIRREGAEVTVISPAAPASPAEYVLDDVRVQRVRYWIPRWQSLATGPAGIVPNLKARPWLLLQAPPLLIALARRAARLAPHFNVVHAHWIYPSGLAAALARRRLAVPLVISSHGTDLRLAQKSGLLRSVARIACKCAEVCIGVSHALCDEMVQLGVPQEKLRFLPLGVDPPSASGPDMSANDDYTRYRGFDGLRLLFVGRLVPVKSVETLLLAHHRLERSGHAVATAIVGAGTDERRLRAIAHTHGVNNILFAGQQSPPAVQEWIAAADILVLTSAAEGRGLVIVEAMAHGLPVVATDIPGPRELVDDGHTGFLFPAGQSERLADRIRTLAEDPELRAMMGRRGREWLEREGLFSHQVARRHIDLYRELAQRVSERRAGADVTLTEGAANANGA